MDQVGSAEHSRGSIGPAGINCRIEPAGQGRQGKPAAAAKILAAGLTQTGSKKKIENSRAVRLPLCLPVLTGKTSATLAA